MKGNLYFYFLISALLILAANKLPAQLINKNPKQVLESNTESLNAMQKLKWLELRNPATGRIPANIRKKELQFAKTLPTKEQQQMQMKKSGYTNIQSYSWTQRGPYNIGGRTRALAIDVNDGNTILAGGVNGGMWKSTDDGASWKETTSPEDIQSVTCVTQDIRSGHTNTWYYGTGEFTIMPVGIVNSATAGVGFDSSLMFLGNGIFKSSDDGNSWSLLTSTQTPAGESFGPFSIVYNVVTDPANLNQDEILAATSAGIMHSSDGGATWDTTLPNFFGLYSNISVTSKGVFYAAINYGSFPLLGGIFRSTDGVNWTDITPNNFPVNTNQTAIGIAPSNENVVYFLSDTASGFTDGHMLWKYTYLSGDGSGSGGSWQDRTANLPNFGVQGFDFDSQWGYCISIGVKPDDENTVFIGEVNLIRSTDGFATNSNIAVLNDTSENAPFNTDHVDHHVIIFSRTNSNLMYVAGDGGVYKTSDDMDSPPNWTSLNNGYFTTQFYATAIDHSTTDDIIIAGAQDNGTIYSNSSSPTAQWNEINGGDGEYCYISDNGSSYYVSYTFGGLFREILDNNGNIISSGSIYPPLNPLEMNGIIEPYVLDPNNNNVIYYAQADVIWRNSDVTAIPLNGQNSPTTINWTKFSNTSTSGSYISAIGISKTPANRIYYGTYDGEIFRLDNSNSASSTPVDVSSNKGLPSGAFVYCIAVDPNNGDKAIVSFSNYYIKSLFYTTDAGNTWTSISGNLEQYPDGSGDGPSTRWVKILPINNSYIYFVGTSTGVYSTTTLNGDKTVWMREGASTIGNSVVDAIDARSTDGLVVVATHGKGIFTTHVTTSTGTDTAGVLLSYDNNNPETGAYETLPNKDWVLANRLTAPNKSFKIDKLIFYIQGDDSTGNASFYPVVYPGSISFFGTPDIYPFYTGQLFTPQKGWNSIDISSNNITNPSTSGTDFWVGVKYDGKNEPIIGLDTVSNGRAWEYNPDKSNWIQLDNYNPPFPATLYIRAEISTVTSVDEINTEIPKEFSLSQNYPNPFNPATTIEYNLPKAEKVKLIVYDILGREVASLVDADQNAGEYKIQWNGRNDFGSTVASGIYLYSFEAGNYHSVKKMIYLK